MSSPVTKVFIVSQDRRQIHDWLKNNFKELEGRIKFKDEFLLTVNHDDRTRLFIINSYNSLVEELMTKYMPKSL